MRKYPVIYGFTAYCVFAILFTVTSFCSQAAESPDAAVYRQQADSFVSSLPEGMQALQTAAIRRAIAGNSRSLVEIRASRNVAPTLPDGVERRPVKGNMALFRSNKFEGDTLPLLVYLHGGGWTIGSINSCARYCAAMADNGVAVLAVDYRLAPEHPFPAGLNDCIDAVKTASDSLATWQCNSISLGGDSSGGNLAVAAALAGLPCRVAGLVLFYPVTEAYADNSESWIEYGEGYGLDAALMDAFNDAYTDDSRNPLVSPALAPDSALVSLPPLLLVAAERDILRSQGEKFAVRLEKLGVDVTHRLIPGSVHLFITVPGQPAAFDEAVRQSRVFLHAL